MATYHTLVFDVENVVGQPLPGNNGSPATASIWYDRDIILTSGALIPANTVVVTDIPSTGTASAQVIPADDPDVASASRGFGIIVLIQWESGSGAQYQRYSRQYTAQVLSADAATVNLSAKIGAEPMQQSMETVQEVFNQAAAAGIQGPAGPTGPAGPPPTDANVSPILKDSTSQSYADVQAAAAASSAVQGKVDKGSLVINVKDYGAKGDGVTDDTASIQSAAAALSAAASTPGTLHFPPGSYAVKVTEGQSLCSFTNQTGIIVQGHGATLNDSTVYSNNGPFTTMFLFDSCTDCAVLGLAYTGPVLSSPSTLLGYQGCILVRAVSGTNGLRVDMRAANCRYGVQTGEYGDPTKGQCSNLDVKIRGTFIGYSLAAYYADGIRHDLQVNGVHRICYIAGCNDVKGTARWQNQYIASVGYLITDVLISGTDAAAQANPTGSPTTSRGSTDIDVTVTELGSTVSQPNSMVAGISLSRVDPCTYRNIRVNSQVATSSNTLSTTIGAWSINSTANGIWSRYPTNWTPSIVLEDIHVQVNSDHSGQTVPGSTTGDIYIFTYDTTPSTGATVRNMSVAGTVKKSPAETRTDYFMLPGLLSGAALNLAHNGTLTVLSNTAVPVEMTGTYNVVNVANLAGGSPLAAKTAFISSLVVSGASTNVQTDGTSLVGGVGPLRHIAETTLTLSGAVTYFGNAFPQNALSVSVQTRVETAITGATGYQVGINGATNRYGDNLPVAAGTTSGIKSYLSTETAPRYYQGGVSIALTALGGSFTGGTVRVIVVYDVFPDPTS